MTVNRSHSQPNHRYTVDLAAQQAECEANYARIMQLLPNLASVDCYEFGVQQLGDQKLQFQVLITERCKYTTMLDICQRSDGDEKLWSPTPDFSVRVYHDARMAEVVSYNRHRNLRARYNYPNQSMYQSDEKTQLNLFLGEWLSHCLEYGHILEDPVMAGSY